MTEEDQNIIKLKEYIDLQIKQVGLQITQERELREMQAQAAQIAIDKTEATVVARFENHNEWRRQINDTAQTYATLVETRVLREKIANLEDSKVSGVEFSGMVERIVKLENSENSTKNKSSIIQERSVILWMIILVLLAILGLRWL